MDLFESIPSNFWTDPLIDSLATAPVSTGLDAAAWNERGAVCREQGDLHSAIAAYDNALRLDPALAVVWNNRGVAYQELGQFPAALADFSQALRLDPTYADAHGNRAAVRIELGDLDGAEADCRRALALAPGIASHHARRGALLHRQKHWAGARSAYDFALQIDPGIHWAYLLRGNASYHLGDWQALCADYRKAFTLGPDRCAGLVVRALRAAIKSDAAEALHNADEHLQRHPDDPIAHAHRGLLLLLLGSDCSGSGEAEAHFARCKALFAEAAPYLDCIVQRAKEGSGHPSAMA